MLLCHHSSGLHCLLITGCLKYWSISVLIDISVLLIEVELSASSSNMSQTGLDVAGVDVDVDCCDVSSSTGAVDSVSDVASSIINLFILSKQEA